MFNSFKGVKSFLFSISTTLLSLSSLIRRINLEPELIVRAFIFFMISLTLVISFSEYLPCINDW